MVRPFPWARALFAASLLVAVAAAAQWLPPWTSGLALAGVLASIGAGVFLLSSGMFARPVLAAAAAQAGARLALTFDDGPDPLHTRRVLDLLEARGHRATFFVIGARAEREPELLREIVQRGHALANHSYAHPYTLPFQTPAAVAADLERAQAVLERASGVRPRWFRPPVGLLSPRVVAGARLAGVELVGWSATARDGARSATVDQCAARLLRAIAPGAILVLHDAVERGGRAPLAAEVLSQVLDAMERAGLRSVTLDELLVQPTSAAAAAPSRSETATMASRPPA